MVGTSRCIAATLSKFGGPKTLPQATPSLCVLTSDSSFFARMLLRFEAGIFSASKAIRSIKSKFIAKGEKGFLRRREVADGVWAHVQGRQATASFAADA